MWPTLKRTEARNVKPMILIREMPMGAMCRLAANSGISIVPGETRLFPYLKERTLHRSLGQRFIASMGRLL